jgi:membrane protease YdiL (CAAX protease family)
MNSMSHHPLTIFWILSFAITWGVGAIAAFAPSEVLGTVAFYVAVYGPTLAALGLAFALGGTPALKQLLQQSIKWRVRLHWYLLVLIGLPLSWLVAVLIARVLGFDTAGSLRFDALLLPVLLITDPGPLGEEIGWRGFALPLLLKRYTTLVASIILGIVWALWHLPVFMLPGFPQSGGPFLLFTLALIAQSVIMTWIYLETKGSVLLAGILFHLMINATISLEGAPYIIWVILMMVCALITLVVMGVRRVLESPFFITKTHAR